MIHDKKDERINIGAGMVPTYHATESVDEAMAVVESCKTPTELLRAMLDDRGVKYETDDVSDSWYERTTWSSENNLWWTYEVSAIEELPYGTLTLLDTGSNNSMMPAQAIAATLGTGKCTLINAADDLGRGTSSFMCFECGYTALDDWWEEFNFCPNCGRRVINE